MKNSFVKPVLFLAALFLVTSCGTRDHGNPMFEMIPVTFSKNDSKISLIDRDGNLILEDEFPTDSRIVMREGIITEYTKKGEVKYHFIKGKNLQSIGSEKYSDGTPFFEGYAVVRMENGMLSLINDEGKTVIENLSKVNDENIVLTGIPSEGLIRFKNEDGLWGYLNTQGVIEITPQFGACENFRDGKARVILADGKFAVIDKKGQEIFKGKDDFTYQPLHEGLMVFSEKGGKQTLWGALNMEGEKAIKDNKFSEISPFYEGMAAAKVDNEWGVINKTGEYIGDLRAKFTMMPLITSDGNIIVNENNKVRIFDNKGTQLVSLDDYESAWPYSQERYIAYRKNGKAVLIDPKGKELSKDAFYPQFHYNNKLFGFALNNFLQPCFMNHWLNNITVESKYFDFNALFSSLFTQVSTNGMMRLNNRSSIRDVLTYFPNEAPSGPSMGNLYVDRSDNYGFNFTQFAREKQEPVSPPEEAAEATPAASATAAPAESIESSEETVPEQIKDEYPYLSNWYSTYSPATRYAPGLSYNLTFQFTEAPKKAIEGKDPIFTDQVSVIGYSLNPEARLQSITVQFQFYNVDSEVFWKEFESKITAAGWRKERNGMFRNTSNRNEISYGTYYLTYQFEL